MTNESKTNKPFLRGLKLAYKLHKAGLDVDNTKLAVWAFAVRVDHGEGDTLPSAAAPVEAILAYLDETGMVDGSIASMADQLGFKVVE